MISRRHFTVPFVAISFATLAWAHNLEEFTLVASDGALGDEFGASVEVHGDTIVVGAPRHDAIASDNGAAYVFVYDGEEFLEEAKLLAADPGAGDLFGSAVAVSGDTIIVGAPAADPNGNASGIAYVFVRTGTTWTQQATLTPTLAEPNEFFGNAVAISGDTAVIGAFRPDSVGSAYIFVRTGSTWSQQTRLIASNASNFNGFGVSVSIEGDLVLVGASTQDAEFANSGAAYMFSRSGTVWSEDQKIQAADGGTGDLFGQSVSISSSGDVNGDGVLVIGAPGEDEGGTDAGAAYRYGLSGGTWTQLVKRLGNAGDTMGVAVDVVYDFVIAGAPNYDFGGRTNCGGMVLWYAPLVPGLAQLFVTEVLFNGGHHGVSVAIDECWTVGGNPNYGESGIAKGTVFVFEIVGGKGVLLNGTGVNPEVMATEEGPNVGDHWHVEFDTSAFPNVDRTLLMVYSDELVTPKMTRWGELFVDLASTRVLMSIVAGTGIVEHEFDIPNDPFMIGTRWASQGALLSSPQLPGRPRYASAFRIETFTNAERVIIGCYGHDD